MSQNQPAPAPRPDRSDAQPSLGELISRISDNVTALIKGEIDLAKAKGKQLAIKGGMGAGLLVAAGVLALYALGLILAALTRLIALALPLWASQLIVAAILLAAVAIMAAVGARCLKSAQADIPAPQVGLRKDLDTASSALREGLRKGNEK